MEKRKVNGACLWVGTNGRWGTSGKGVGGWMKWKYYVLMYEMEKWDLRNYSKNEGRGKRRMMERVNFTKIPNKHFCKCHNILSGQQ
jgi:hypothetical protein